jgi:NTP pyrophosphatase (non-canonical NTP hydrolase)
MGSLNFYRDATMDVCRYKGWDNTSVETVWMLLTEEIGELAGAIRQYSGPFKKHAQPGKKPLIHMRNELGDVFSYLFQLASMLDIDLDKMWYWHQHNMVYKHYPPDEISQQRV